MVKYVLFNGMEWFIIVYGILWYKIKVNYAVSVRLLVGLLEFNFAFLFVI